MLQIKTNNNTIEIYTPFNRDFTDELKNAIGGHKWDSSKKCWTAPLSSVDEVRELMVKHFGESDISSVEKVDVKICVNNSLVSNTLSVAIFGKTIAKAYGRDTVAPLPAGVSYLSGSYGSGGSAKHPHVVVNKGSVIMLHDVPMSAIKNCPSEITYEIVKRQSKIDALKAEKVKLLARLDEINKELAEV